MSFEVEDVVVLAFGIHPGFTAGCEVTVLGILDDRYRQHPEIWCGVSGCRGMKYYVGDLPDGYSIAGCETCMRKKRPPGRSDAELVKDLMSKITKEKIPEEA
jgi:hypothetical protein